MSLGYRARRRWSLAVLVIGLPVYIVVAVSLIGLFDRPPIWVELLIYVGLGIVWTLPLRVVFSGVGCEDPDRPSEK